MLRQIHAHRVLCKDTYFVPRRLHRRMLMREITLTVKLCSLGILYPVRPETNILCSASHVEQETVAKCCNFAAHRLRLCPEERALQPLRHFKRQLDDRKPLKTLVEGVCRCIVKHSARRKRFACSQCCRSLRRDLASVQGPLKLLPGRTQCLLIIA